MRKGERHREDCGKEKADGSTGSNGRQTIPERDTDFRLHRGSWTRSNEI
jgi:hypothetical protein